MPVRTNRLFGPTTLTLLVASMFTCPSARTARILSLRIVNPGGTSSIYGIYLGGTTTPFLIAEGSVPALSTVVDLGLVVVEPGEQLYANSSPAGIVLSGHGALLEGPPT